MFFYQQAGVPNSYYRQPVHRMYMQYQQPYRAAAQRRSAYVAGNQVAASGSFLKGLISSVIAKKLSPFKNLFAKQVNIATTSVQPSDAAVAEQETFADEVAVAVEQNDEAVSIAEAYPAAAADEEQDEVAADEPQHDEQPEFLDAPAADEAPLADPVAVAPVPKKKNKVTIELDTQADDEEVAVLGDEVPVYKKPQRPAARPSRPAYGPAPSNPIHTYFPINFGNTNGGAIAVANAYSTGQKGGARSHAIAYGSPATAAAKKQKRRQSVAAAVAE